MTLYTYSIDEALQEREELLLIIILVIILSVCVPSRSLPIQSLCLSFISFSLSYLSHFKHQNGRGDLSDFNHGVLVDAGGAGLSISEASEFLGFRV